MFRDFLAMLAAQLWIAMSLFGHQITSEQIVINVAFKFPRGWTLRKYPSRTIVSSKSLFLVKSLNNSRNLGPHTYLTLVKVAFHLLRFGCTCRLPSDLTHTFLLPREETLKTDLLTSSVQAQVPKTGSITDPLQVYIGCSAKANLHIFLI